MIGLTSMEFAIDAEVLVTDPGRYTNSNFGQHERRITKTAVFGGDGVYDVEVEDNGASEGDRTVTLEIYPADLSEVTAAMNLRAQTRVRFVERMGCYECGVEYVQFSGGRLSIGLTVYRKLS